MDKIYDLNRVVVFHLLSFMSDGARVRVVADVRSKGNGLFLKAGGRCLLFLHNSERSKDNVYMGMNIHCA